MAKNHLQALSAPHNVARSLLELPSEHSQGGYLRTRMLCCLLLAACLLVWTGAPSSHLGTRWLRRPYAQTAAAGPPHAATTAARAALPAVPSQQQHNCHLAVEDAAPIWSPYCQLLRQVCADQSTLILYERQYQQAGGQRAGNLPHLEVDRSKPYVFPWLSEEAVGDIDSSGSSGSGSGSGNLNRGGEQGSPDAGDGSSAAQDVEAGSGSSESDTSRTGNGSGAGAATISLGGAGASIQQRRQAYQVQVRPASLAHVGGCRACHPLAHARRPAPAPSAAQM